MSGGEATTTLPYVPVDARPWRLGMGLRRLDPSRWLEVDGRRGEELALKTRLLATTPERVTAALPGSEAAGAELLAAVLAHLEAYHPGLVRVDASGTLTDVGTGLVVDPAGLHPVDAAARMVQEDLCVMSSDGAGWVLAAASVCFPSRWSLADKIGCDLSQIHGPVAGYDATLDRPVRTFFDRLRPDRPVWRLNWTLIDSPDLHQPEPEGRHHPGPAADPGERLWFRVERQTLRRSSVRPSVTFTIRTYVTRLDELVDRHPEVVPPLRTNLLTVPPDAVEYKGWTGLVGPVCDWLDTRR